MALRVSGYYQVPIASMLNLFPSPTDQPNTHQLFDFISLTLSVETNHREFVVEGGGRPEICSYGIHSYWPQLLQDLINKCWQQDLFLRPSFAQIESELDKCLRLEEASVSGSGPSSPSKARRTSTRSSSAKKRVGTLMKSASEKMTNHSDGLNRSLGRSGRSSGSRSHIHPA